MTNDGLSPIDTPPDPARPGPLGRIARFSVRHRWLVLAGWLVAVVLATIASRTYGGQPHADYSVPGSSSKAAQTVLEESFPGQSGAAVDVVVRVEGGAASAEREVNRLLTDLAKAPHVFAVGDPYADAGGLSPDGSTVLTTVQMDLEEPPASAGRELLAVAERAERPGLDVALGGEPIEAAQSAEPSSETIGLVAAAVVLLLAFGSVIAAGLPILVALLGLGVSISLVSLLAAATSVPEWATALTAMIGIGVGIDYVLLMVTRLREQLAAGKSVEDSIIASVETAGRSVLVAGTTVVISMLGLFSTGLSYVRGASLTTVFAVLIVMLASVTVVPALFGILGRRVDALALPWARRSGSLGSPRSGRWSARVQRHPTAALAAGAAVLIGLSAPIVGVQFGFPDAGNDGATTSTRQAYDMTARAFGPGANGPLLVALRLDQAADPRAAADDVARALPGVPGVASAASPVLSENGRAALIQVVPTTGPQDPATDQTVKRLRDTALPQAVAGTGATASVGGIVAANIDSTDDVVKRLPLLIGSVVALSMLLLLGAFHSLAVALKAAVLNLLSIGAAFGVVALVLEGGAVGQLIGIDTPTPLPAFLPVLMFAILFGLSMDYEVFLVSRIRERWARTGSTTRAITEGVEGTSRVIMAAAAIMIAVFAAFALSPDVFLKALGVGMATAILVDATLVRMLLVPSIMQLLGERNWWVPRWLDRVLPDVNIEGPAHYHLDHLEPDHLEPGHLPGQVPAPRKESEQSAVQT